MLLRNFIVAVFMLCHYTAKSDTTITNIVNAISAVRCTAGSIDYAIYLPSSENPVTYDISFESYRCESDTLAPCCYQIDWGTGFCAYFNGHHYRYRDIKLQEYHFAIQPELFVGTTAVQKQAQFAELLPQFIAERLESWMNDSACSIETRYTENAIRVCATKNVSGYTAAVYEIAFDCKNYLPITFAATYNPSSISDQSVTVTYNYANNAECHEIDERKLVSEYPEVFEKYRASNFRVENLINEHLPAFSAMTPLRERFTFERDDTFDRATIIVFLDVDVSTTEATIAAVRNAVRNAPKDVNVIYALNTADADVIDEMFSELFECETILMSARSFAVDCGVSMYPTLLMCSGEGKVKSYTIGFNKNLSSVVIQQMALCDSNAKN
jgi:hypothetical protein